MSLLSFPATPNEFLRGTNAQDGVLQPYAISRRVVLPTGRWTDDQVAIHRGPTVFESPATLERLPHYQRKSVQLNGRHKP